MTWRTHVLVGISSLWLLERVPGAIGSGDGVNNLGVLTAFASLGALLPDLDASESKVRHLSVGGGITPLLPVSNLLHRAFGHRGLLHSAMGFGLMAVLVALPLAWWIGWPPAFALWLGYGSHLAADACTRSGIPLWFPRRERGFLLPKALRIVTGSTAEAMLLPLLALVVMGLLLHVLFTPQRFDSTANP